MNIFRRRWNIAASAKRGGASRAFRVAWLVWLVLFFAGSKLSGEEVDRLLVAVNGKVITEGDLHIARALNALISPGGKVDPVPSDDEMDRLIDLELMRQEFENFSLNPEDESSVDESVQELRNHYAKTGGLPRLLELLGLQESELISFLRLEISILKFVKFRFRPFASVSKSEIEAYYNGTYATQLRELGIELPPLAEVSDEIEENLRESKINDALDQWIIDARGGARIEYFHSDYPQPVSGNNPRESNQPGITE